MTKRRDRGEGSLHYDNARGLWVGTVDLGRDGSGKRHRRSVTGRTKTQARTKLRELRRELETGQSGPVLLTVGELCAQWYATAIEPSGLSEPTKYQYRRAVDGYITPGVGAHRVRDLTCDHVDAMLGGMVADGYAESTIRRVHVTLTRLLRWGERRGLASRNVSALCDTPTGPVKQRRALTVEQSLSLLSAVEGDRMEGFLTVALMLGLRPGELAALPWDAVNFDAGTLTVRQSLRRQPGGGLVIVPPKTAAGRRCLVMPRPVVDALRVHRQRQRRERVAAGAGWRDTAGLVFTAENGAKLDPSNVRRELRRLCAKSGIPRISPHELRHSAASLMLDAGLPPQHVADVLGHATLRMTTETYRHRITDAVSAAVPVMEAVYGGGR